MRAHHHHSHDTKTGGSVVTVLLGVAAIALAGIAGTIGMVRAVGDLGPKLGDIVAFDPLETMSKDMKAQVPAIPVDSRPGVRCVLDVQTMHASGGSVVIESRLSPTGYGTRVHWAGARSAEGGTNCGSSADLLVSQDDLEVLAMAAGGFGTIAAKKARGVFWGFSADEP
jgi:hypothetical protein